MSKRIFIIGQCTLHWGRMEFGNIGNFYIIKPLFEELRRVFPEAEIATTMQLSEGFCQKFSIEIVPMEFYYDFNSDKNLSLAIYEYEQVLNSREINTTYIEQIKKADLVIDFSGDIWGDNADFLGYDRFATGCYKDLTAQLLRPTVMIAGSPGPFSNNKNRDLARKTYAGFEFVSNREPVSTRLLESYRFDLSKTFNYACPSFLFTKSDSIEMEGIFREYGLIHGDKRLKIGFVLCGWNFKRAPFSAWPREEEEYVNFLEVIKFLVNKYGAYIYLLSHSNGFNIPPSPFVLKHGRDFPIMKQLYEILENRGYEKNITLIDGVYSPEETKAIISQFDVLISGRMHGAVAGISEKIPTLIIDYGHEPKAHKLKGFAEIIGKSGLIADPNDLHELFQKIDYLMIYREKIRVDLEKNMENIKKSAQMQFERLKEYMR